MDPVLNLLSRLSDPLATADQRRAAEAWVAGDGAWAWCAACLVHADGEGSSQQLPLVPQILRYKLNNQGWQLPADQLLQLRDLLLRRLRAVPAVLSGAALSELLLALAAVFCLLPEWGDPVETACAAGLGELQVARTRGGCSAGDRLRLVGGMQTCHMRQHAMGAVQHDAMHACACGSNITSMQH